MKEKNTCKKKLSLDCVTRWNSTYLMLETAICYKDVFGRLDKREEQFKSNPSESEWSFAIQVCEKLKVFYELTTIFSGSKYPTSNLYFRKNCEVRLDLRTWTYDKSEVIRKMAKNMIAKFDKYWSVIQGILSVAIVLDPRYKMEIVEYWYEKLFGEVYAAEECRKVSKLCYDLLREYQNKDVNNDLTGGSSQMSGAKSRQT